MTATEPTPYGPTWYAATVVAAPQRPTLTYDLDVDVCVIGGGLAGLTTAREVARRGWSVAVVEAKQIGANASGGNGGVVAPGFAEPLEAIVERVGLKLARELWALSAEGVEYIRGAIRDTGMTGVDPVDGRLVVRTIDDEDDLLRQVAMLRVDFGIDVEAWPTAQVREVLLSERYFQGMHLASAFHIHPLNYALGLAAAAEQAGARIFEATPALAIDTQGVRKRVDTPGGRVRSAHIVLAGGVELGTVLPALAETVVPVSTYVATTAPLGERLFDAVRYTGAVADSRRAHDAYRIVGGDRLMWGGRITTRTVPARRMAKLAQRDICKAFPQLDGVEVVHAWSGVTGYAVHKMPQIGELDRGVWLAGAFGMHGLNTSAMAGELIARAIVEDDDRWRLFSDYELVWAGGRLGRAAAQAVLWSLPIRDASASALARLRHAWHRRAAERIMQKAAAVARGAAEEVRRREAQETARLAAEEVARRLAQSQRQAAEAAAQRAAEEAGRRGAVEAERRAADEAARHAAENMAQRLADALHQADQQAVRRTGDEAVATEPDALATAARASAELLHAVAPTRSPPTATDGSARAPAETTGRIDAFDESALRAPISVGPELARSSPDITAIPVDQGSTLDEPAKRGSRAPSTEP